MMWNGYGMGVGMLLTSALAFVLLLALVAGAAYLLWKIPRGSAGQAHSQAETVLAERYARSEIDETEYRKRLETLRSR